MRITFVTCKFGNVERNSHCDVLHIAPVRVANLVLDGNGVFAIKAYRIDARENSGRFPPGFSIQQIGESNFWHFSLANYILIYHQQYGAKKHHLCCVMFI